VLVMTAALVLALVLVLAQVQQVQVLGLAPAQRRVVPVQPRVAVLRPHRCRSRRRKRRAAAARKVWWATAPAIVARRY
jgi:hypothetical protein